MLFQPAHLTRRDDFGRAAEQSNTEADAWLERLWMDPDNVQLVDCLRVMQEETASAYSEAEAFLVRVPAARLAVQECVAELQSAEQDLEEFQAIATERQLRLEYVLDHTQQLLGQEDVPPILWPPTALPEPPASVALGQELSELEEQHVVLLRSCQQASREAIMRADQRHLAMKQGLVRHEHQASLCSLFLEDRSQAEETLRSRHAQRIELLVCDFEAVEEAGRARAQVAEAARAELGAARQRWLAEREDLMRGSAHWEAQLAEARTCAGREEAEAQRAAQWQRDELAAARSSAARASEAQRATELARRRAEELAAEAREVSERRRVMNDLVEEERGLVALLATRLAVESFASEVGEGRLPFFAGQAAEPLVRGPLS